MYSNCKKIKDEEKNAESQSRWRTYIYWRKDKNYIDFSKTTQVRRERSEMK